MFSLGHDLPPILIAQMGEGPVCIKTVIDNYFCTCRLEVPYSMHAGQPSTGVNTEIPESRGYVGGGETIVDQLEIDRERFLTLIRKWHADHPRRDQVDHCINVARWLEHALDLEPGPVANRRNLVLAALGHDLYEDTAIPSADIVAGFGAKVDRLIDGLTEKDGDIAGYIERVASGPEEVRLIKLCDGIDNYGGLVKNELGVSIIRDRAKRVHGFCNRATSGTTHGSSSRRERTLADTSPSK
jgi:hypothetical protein